MMKLVDYFYSIIIYFHNKNSLFLEKYIFKILKVLLNILFPIYYIFRKPKFGNIKKREDEYLIISLTSYSRRINNVWQVVYTLLCQSLKPDKIILWLSEEEFGNISNLPNNLKKLVKYGLEVRFCKDIGPHKKYYYTMKNYPQAIVITVDDDVYYPSNTVELLYKKHLEFPNSVCCNWAHEITFDSERHIRPYSQWKSAIDNHNMLPQNKIFPVGYQGVLYPAKCLDNIVFSEKSIARLAPTTDDIWLKFAAFLNKTKAIRTDKGNYKFFEIISSQKYSLFKINVKEYNKNDKSIKLIKNYFQKELRDVHAK